MQKEEKNKHQQSETKMDRNPTAGVSTNSIEFYFFLFFSGLWTFNCVKMMAKMWSELKLSIYQSMNYSMNQ